MQQCKSVLSNPLIFCGDLIGFEGYNVESLFCGRANDDGNYYEYGIANNSLLVIDGSLPYQEGQLNLFLTGSSPSQSEQYKISKTSIEGAVYQGRILMSVNQFA